MKVGCECGGLGLKIGKMYAASYDAAVYRCTDNGDRSPMTLEISFRDASNVTIAEHMYQPQNAKASTLASGPWARYSTAFTVPENAVTVQFTFKYSQDCDTAVDNPEVGPAEALA